jgi:serine phosphatase RsbU (regulator of sigma subunit)
VVESPTESTTIVVGDVVGHGLEAARHAAFVRAPLATFARFTSRAAKRDTTGPVDLFGEERSRQEVRHHRKAPPERVLQALVTAVTTYAGGPLAHDLCLVAVRAESASAH